MLFLGLGTGLGSPPWSLMALSSRWNWHIFPIERADFEDYVGKRGLDRKGKKKWREHVADVVAKLTAALEPDDVVPSGGNVKNLIG